MMGRQHALVGAAAWLAALPVVEPLEPAQQVTGLGLCVGASMVPDFDMPGSTIARTYGPVTNTIARGVAVVARGHRKGTHCLLGLAVLTAAAAALTITWQGIAAAVWLLLGTGARAAGMTDMDGPGRLRGPRWYRYLVGAVTNALTMALVTVLVLAVGVDVGPVLPWAVAVGAGSHIATDCLTDKGCPLLYPFSRRRFRIPLFTTGGRGKDADARARSTRRLTHALTALVVVLAVVRVA